MSLSPPPTSTIDIAGSVQSSPLSIAVAGACVGDLLSIPSGILVQGCNTLGAMGAGLAKTIAQRFPEVYEAYHSAHKNGGLTLGQVIFVRPTTSRPFWVANAITQDRIGRQAGVRYADLPAIVAAFQTIVVQANLLGLTIHYPLIGAGLGGLPWPEVCAALGPIWNNVAHQLWVHPHDALAKLVRPVSSLVDSSPLTPPAVSSRPPSCPSRPAPFTGRWARPTR